MFSCSVCFIQRYNLFKYIKDSIIDIDIEDLFTVRL